MKRLSFYKNYYKEQSIYILASGPSIKKENLALLKDKVSIGINASPLLEKEYGFNSQFYTVSDTRFLTHPEKFRIATDLLDKQTIRVFRSELSKYDSNLFKDRTYYLDALGKNGFSFDIAKGFFFGASTTLLAVQLAYYLGAKNIFLLGVDLKYDGENPRFYSEEEVQEYDHFTSTQLANLRNAYLVLKEKNINLYNCSENSLLRPYMPYMPFEESNADSIVSE
jgi:hypothetical protein